MVRYSTKKTALYIMYTCTSTRLPHSVRLWVFIMSRQQQRMEAVSSPDARICSGSNLRRSSQAR